MLVAMAAGLAAQGTAQARRFDAVSIRPADPNVRVVGRVLDPTRLSYPAVTLQTLILDAYGVEGWQLSGGPDWIRKDRFALTAESAEPADSAAMMLMLRQALADRFGLRLEQTTKAGEVFRLAVAPGGVKLSDKPVGKVPGLPTLGHVAIATADGAPLPIIAYTLRTHRYGDDGRETTTTANALLGQLATAADLAQAASTILKAPVTDATGLRGKYYFEFIFDDGALTGALRTQLGLTLVKTHGAYSIYRVVAAAEPQAN